MKILLKTLFTLAVLLVVTVPAHCEVLDRIVAIVNDDIITLKELEKFVHVDKQTSFASINEYLNNLKLEEKLGIFIDGLLIKQQAKKLKVDITNKELEAIIDNIKKQNLITDTELREQLKKENINYDGFVEGIKLNVLKGRVVARVISSEVKITDSALKEFYEERKENFRNEEYHLKQVFVSAQKADAEKRVMEAYSLLEKRSFEEIASEYSDDPSAKVGGDIGVVKAEDLLPVLRQSLQSLEPGRYTKIILTPYGFHILKLVKINRGDIIPFEAIKDKIEEIIVFQESEKRYKQYIDKLRHSSYIEVKI